MSVALGISLVLHAVLLALAPADARRAHAPFPLTARLVPAPKPTLPVLEPPPRAPRAGKAPAKPAAAPPPPRPRPAPPLIAPAQTPVPAAPLRTPSFAVSTAYEELAAPLEAEKLTDAQRAIPRGIELASPPKPAGPIRPRYPAEALAQGRKGYVLLEVFVDADGGVEDVVVIEDGGTGALAEAASEAARRAKFRPAEGPGGRTASRVTLRIEFSFE